MGPSSEAARYRLSSYSALGLLRVAWTSKEVQDAHCPGFRGQNFTHICGHNVRFSLTSKPIVVSEFSTRGSQFISKVNEIALFIWEMRKSTLSNWWRLFFNQLPYETLMSSLNLQVSRIKFFILLIQQDRNGLLWHKLFCLEKYQ